MKVVIIKYNAGNVCSVAFALGRIGITAEVSEDAQEILSADKVIFPGVGEAGTAMEYLKEKMLDELIPSLKQDVLGICLGMQLMCSSSEEGNTKGLGIFNQEVIRFRGELKCPHMGWNTISGVNHPLFRGVEEGAYMYFVHSYYAGISADTLSRAHYGTEFSSGLQKNNFYGLQFHPEKSGKRGQQILENFINL